MFSAISQRKLRSPVVQRRNSDPSISSIEVAEAAAATADRRKNAIAAHIPNGIPGESLASAQTHEPRG
jgi:hypothetical protein